jgi:DNA polymerase III subunit delta
MKLTGRAIDGFLRRPDAQMRAVLLYGPDAGLVGERAATLARHVVSDVDDPFRIVTLTGAVLADDPARLADEMGAISMFGGRRLIRVRDVADKAVAAFTGALALGPASDALIVVEAGDLPPRSALRQFFEKADSAAALPCYLDEAGDVARVVRDSLAEAKLQLDRDAELYLAESLVGDRQLARRAIEKLITYMGSEKRVTLAHAQECVGDSTEQALDELPQAMADGNVEVADRVLQRLLGQGEAPVRILRVLQGHMLRLHQAASLMAAGQTADAAVAALRPPPFFKTRERMVRQAQKRILQRLFDAEAACKRNGPPPELLCSHVALEVTRACRRRS